MGKENYVAPLTVRLQADDQTKVVDLELERIRKKSLENEENPLVAKAVEAGMLATHFRQMAYAYKFMFDQYGRVCKMLEETQEELDNLKTEATP